MLFSERNSSMTVPGEKIALFIDGANLYATAKSLGFEIDYKRLLREFQSLGYLLRAFYYTAVPEDREYSSTRPLIDWLDYNGYTVVTKATKEFVDQTGRRKVKGNMDIELAVDAMEIANYIGHMVLFSGDGDFRSLVEDCMPCSSSSEGRPRRVHPSPPTTTTIEGSLAGQFLVGRAVAYRVISSMWASKFEAGH
jgi:hypothetical protein